MLPVADLDRSTAFYADLLGFKMVSRSEQIVRLEGGGGSLFLVPHSPPTEDKPGVEIACCAELGRTPVNLTFRVADLAAAYAELAGRGVRFLAAPAVKPWGEIRAFTRDPDGYLVEIYERLAGDQ